MDSSMKNTIENCFSWHNSPENAFGAPALMEREGYWDEIDLHDDDDLEALMELAMRSMRMGDTPNADFVEYLVSKGFDINTRLPGVDCLVLQCADSWLGPKVVQRLADLGADVYAENSAGDNILILAAKKEYPPKEEPQRGALALYVAEHFDLARLDKTDRFGITPLMYAALQDHPLLAKALLAHGADVNAAGAKPVGANSYWLEMDGVTPLALACRRGSPEMVRMLLDAGADEAIRDVRGRPAIFSLLRYPFNFFRGSSYNHPIFQRKCEIVGMLRELELTVAEGYTVLMRSLQDSPDLFDKARAYDNLPITLALLERGANIEAAGNDGRRPLHLAVTALGDVEKKLVKAGAELDVQDNEGDTPLLLACRHADEKAVRYLVKAGADISLRNNKGESALDLAAGRGYSDALELMMERA